MAVAARIDFKRALSGLYRPGREPEIVEVPELLFLMVDGHGDPNTSADYREAIEALYAVSYALKFALKRAPDGLDYGVMPLEGLWWGPATAPFTAAPDKSDWSWTAMIMQPDLVTAELFSEALQSARAKRPLPAADRIHLESFHEGTAAQVMHIGPYSEEGPTIAALHAFIGTQDYAPSGEHHEIYLGDPHRSAPEKLRTIVRQPVVPA